MIVAELRNLEKQVLQGEISYSRMVEIINEKMESDAVEFAEWIAKHEFVKRTLTHPKNVGKWWSNVYCEYKTIEEVYNLFKQRSCTI
jgi:hypothetical protein